MKTRLKVTLLLCSSLTVLSAATIAPSLPQMTREFSHLPHGPLLVQVMLTLPGLFIALFSPLVGWIIDRYGRKKMLIASLIVFGISGSTGFYLENLYWILIGRAVLGISVAGLMTTAVTLIGDYFTPEERARFMGIQGASIAFGGVVYISLGGLLADISWESPFLLYLISFLFLPAALLILYEPHREETHGIANRLRDVPEKKKIFLIYGIGLCVMILFYLIPLQIPFLLESRTGVSNTKVGFSIALTTLAGAVSGLLFHRLKKMLHYLSIYALAFLLLGTGYLIISQTSNYAVTLAGLLVSGLGMGLIMPIGSLWLLSIVPLPFRGRIIGGLSTSIFIGQFLSPLIIQPLGQLKSVPTLFMMAALLLFFLFGIFAGAERVIARKRGQFRL